MMSTMTMVLPRPSDRFEGHYRQSYWEIPAALRNATLWETEYYQNDHLFDWVVDSRDGNLSRGMLLVGKNAEEIAAGMVLDLIRQPGVYKRYLEAAIAWSDEGQIVGAWRASDEARETLEFLTRAHILVAKVPQLGTRGYPEALEKLLAVRAKRRNRVTVFWTDEETLAQYRDGGARFGDPVLVDVG